MPTGIRIVHNKRVLPEQVLAYFNIPIHENMCVCPFHSDTYPSMHVNKEYVYCYGCNESWDSLRLYARLVNKLPKHVTQEFMSVDFPLPDESMRYTRHTYKGPVKNDMIDYWHTYLMDSPERIQQLRSERMLSIDTIVAHKLGYNPQYAAWVIPFMYGDRVDTVQFRSLTNNDTGAKYFGLEGHNRGAVMNWDLLQQPQPYVVVLMGAFDGILARQDGIITGGMNGSMPFKQEERERVASLFSKQHHVFIVPDNNEAEYRAADVLASWVSGKVRYFPKELPHNTDYIDYRRMGNSATDFLRDVVGIEPLQEVPESLIDNLFDLYAAGDRYNFSSVHWEWSGKGLAASDVAKALARRLCSKHNLWDVKSVPELEQVFADAHTARGGW